MAFLMFFAGANDPPVMFPLPGAWHRVAPREWQRGRMIVEVLPATVFPPCVTRKPQGNPKQFHRKELRFV